MCFSIDENKKCKCFFMDIAQITLANDKIIYNYEKNPSVDSNFLNFNLLSSLISMKYTKQYIFQNSGSDVGKCFREWKC